MAEKVDYAALKKGGFMRQKQKGCFSLRIAVVDEVKYAKESICRRKRAV